MSHQPARRAGVRGIAARSLLAGALALAGTLVPVQASGAAGEYAVLPGGTFRSVLPAGPGQDTVAVAPYRLAREPVSNAQFARFVKKQPQWKRGAAPKVFVDEHYLQHWSGSDQPAAGTERQPVTGVSWFAAQAYCEASGARLPTWHEWEFAAAADATRPDAREDPAWRQAILDWYARPSTKSAPDAGTSPPNHYGVRDLHGVVWEWVYDYGAMLVSGDNREQGDPDLMKFCGAGALTMEQKENYAVLMRVAMLSSLQGAYTTGNLGFRCAKDGAK